MEIKDIIKEMRSGKGLYDLVANNYYKLSKEDLKEICLNTIYVADDDKAITEEIENRIESDFDKEIEEGFKSNMPCDSYGFCAGSSCKNYYKCQG